MFIHFPQINITQVRNAFEVMAMTPEQIQNVLSMLASILHLGNITFVSTGGAQIADKTHLETAAVLLSLDTERLGDALTQKVMSLRGEEITTPLTTDQVQSKYNFECRAIVLISG